MCMVLYLLVRAAYLAFGLVWAAALDILKEFLRRDPIGLDTHCFAWIILKHAVACQTARTLSLIVLHKGS